MAVEQPRNFRKGGHHFGPWGAGESLTLGSAARRHEVHPSHVNWSTDDEWSWSANRDPQRGSRPRTATPLMAITERRSGSGTTSIFTPTQPVSPGAPVVCTGEVAVSQARA